MDGGKPRFPSLGREDWFLLIILFLLEISSCRSFIVLDERLVHELVPEAKLGSIYTLLFLESAWCRRV